MKGFGIRCCKLDKQFCGLRYKERKAKISEAMEQYFSSEEELLYFIESNFERKKRNVIERNKRMVRKARLADFDFFVTFTFDSKKHTEQSLNMRRRW